ncbi:type II toxin-antitoxin system RelE/ParE family toxin [Blastomonas aquatica]|uniref:Addiction module toxin RelE n=1 Tax=Blastomonas aquatica TaxID=1510276 RepID=A0ABQ1J6N2_9SPHN|nr:type II toxin-antitoxin system RelE/ParE family toxin [Blastomonas aquatica]GGB59254.1 hypothetical protein GCM10010833_12580 [Blastomonas aquatica]
MRRLIWTPAAQKDLSAIDDQLYEEDPEFADRVVISSVRSARFLLDWPFAGPVVGEAGQRKWPIKRTPYILIYRPVDDVILVLRVYHERQDWGQDPGASE